MSTEGNSRAATVAVIAKEPVAGRVKTRLVPPLSDSEAAEVASASLADTIVAVDSTVADDPSIRRLLYFDGEQDSWLPTGWDGLDQCSGSLGERLAQLFRQLDGPAVVFGMDTPQLDTVAIRSALDAVQSSATDSVIGPACDGGYWTIGFNRHVPGAFDGVPMSASDTAVKQREVLSALGLSVRTIAKMRDIDHWGDALAISQEHPHLRTSAAVTRIAERLHRRSASQGDRR